MSLSSALRIDAAGGSVQWFGTPMGLMPSFWVLVYQKTLAARDRFLREIDDAYAEVS
jgi:hypothetical protein